MLRMAISTVDNPAAYRVTYESQEMAIVRAAPLDKKVSDQGERARWPSKDEAVIEACKLARLQKDDGVIKLEWV